MGKDSVVRSFEGARGIAAMIVALYHVTLHLDLGIAYPTVITHGFLFVDLFFVLSGFVICATYSSRLASTNDLGSFVVRRVARLFPLLIFATVAYVITQDIGIAAKQALHVLGHVEVSHSSISGSYVTPSLAELISTMTMTHGLGFFDKPILNWASWSISTEFYSYVLFAALCVLLKGASRLIAFAALSVAAYALTCWASASVHGCVSTNSCMDITSDFGFFRCIASFFLGALMYHLNSRIRGATGILQLTATVAVATLFIAVRTFPLAALLSPIVFAIFILSIARDTGPFAKPLQSQLALKLGQRSYSIYLMHPVVLVPYVRATANINGLIPGLLAIIVYVVCLYILSGWTYRLVEMPFRTLINRLADHPAHAQGSVPE